MSIRAMAIYLHSRGNLRYFVVSSDPRLPVFVSTVILYFYLFGVAQLTVSDLVHDGIRLVEG